MGAKIRLAYMVSYANVAMVLILQHLNQLNNDLEMFSIQMFFYWAPTVFTNKNFPAKSKIVSQ